MQDQYWHLQHTNTDTFTLHRWLIQGRTVRVMIDQMNNQCANAEHILMNRLWFLLSRITNIYPFQPSCILNLNFFLDTWNVNVSALVVYRPYTKQMQHIFHRVRWLIFFHFAKKKKQNPQNIKYKILFKCNICSPFPPTHALRCWTFFSWACGVICECLTVGLHITVFNPPTV